MKRIFNIASHYQQIKGFYLRYERWFMPATLVGGFLVDYLTFTNIQIEITFALLSMYWLITGLTIAFINLYDAEKLSRKFKYARLFAPLLIQFTFGALLSGSLIFYWFSGAFSVSWPVIVIIAITMVFNDIFRHYFLKPMIQISVYFFTTVSLFSVILPFLFHSLSAWLFILASALSVIIFYPYIIFLSMVGDYTRQQKHYFLASIFTIFFIMNFLYFTNIIPPIPLSLREAGLYHSIKVSDGSYTMLGEGESFWQALVPGQALHIKSTQRIYVYTAIFAPVKLQTTIFHDWQYYNAQKKEWISKDMVSFTIIGGRKEGYKGYSWRGGVAPGAWRIYVKNQRGQVLGRIKFNVEKAQEEIELQETIR